MSKLDAEEVFRMARVLPSDMNLGWVLVTLAFWKKTVSCCGWVLVVSIGTGFVLRLVGKFVFLTPFQKISLVTGSSVQDFSFRFDIYYNVLKKGLPHFFTGRLYLCVSYSRGIYFASNRVAPKMLYL